MNHDPKTLKTEVVMQRFGQNGRTFSKTCLGECSGSRLNVWLECFKQNSHLVQRAYKQF
jgi:hypothetical protein